MACGYLSFPLLSFPGTLAFFVSNKYTVQTPSVIFLVWRQIYKLYVAVPSPPRDLYSVRTSGKQIEGSQGYRESRQSSFQQSDRSSSMASSHLAPVLWKANGDLQWSSHMFHPQAVLGGTLGTMIGSCHVCQVPGIVL